MLYPDFKKIIQSWSFNGIGSNSFFIPKKGILKVFNYACSGESYVSGINVIGYACYSCTYINDTLIQLSTERFGSGDYNYVYIYVKEGDKILSSRNSDANKAELTASYILYDFKR